MCIDNLYVYVRTHTCMYIPVAYHAKKRTSIKKRRSVRRNSRTYERVHENQGSRRTLYSIYTINESCFLPGSSVYLAIVGIDNRMECRSRLTYLSVRCAYACMYACNLCLWNGHNNRDYGVERRSERIALHAQRRVLLYSDKKLS